MVTVPSLPTVRGNLLACENKLFATFPSSFKIGTHKTLHWVNTVHTLVVTENKSALTQKLLRYLCRLISRRRVPFLHQLEACFVRTTLIPTRPGSPQRNAVPYASQSHVTLETAAKSCQRLPIPPLHPRLESGNERHPQREENQPGTTFYNMQVVLDSAYFGREVFLIRLRWHLTRYHWTGLK